jgi:hypothetical protein
MNSYLLLNSGSTHAISEDNAKADPNRRIGNLADLFLPPKKSGISRRQDGSASFRVDFSFKALSDAGI